MSKIPKHMIDEAKEGIESLRFYGVPITELDRDELLACVSTCIKSQIESFRRFEEYRKFANDFPRGIRVGTWKQ